MDARSGMTSPSWAGLRNVILVTLLLALLMGCKTELYKGLTEEQANTMLATLMRRGIDAEKIAEGKAGYVLAVQEKQLVQALEILRENSLPREQYQNLGKIFAGDGMIASPSEEQARLSYGISQELSDTFSHIDGVLTARVHVVLASTDLASDVKTPASAGVFLRHTPDSPVVNFIPKIRELAAKAVPGLDYERVSVMLVPVRESVSVPMREAPKFLGLSFFPEAGPPYLFIGAMITVLAAATGLVLVGVALAKDAWIRRQANSEDRQA